MAQRLRFCSKRIAEIPYIETFIADAIEGHREPVWIGWGRKPSGQRAAGLARKTGGTALFLEDGFLRSWGAGHAYPPVSIVSDRTGIYYDGTCPSDLETLLQSEADLIAPFGDKIERARAAIVANRLSKYNHAPPMSEELLARSDGQRVLVVDQTAGDLSIKLGCASAQTFALMLDKAKAENPDATIYVKTHPVTAAGEKEGHFSPADTDERTILLTEPVSPIELLEAMDKVYVVTSTLGFEALICGRPVTCFGLPWYAGWGVTDDRLTCSRRSRERTASELFAAAYFHYASYIDPQTGGVGDIFDAIDWLIRQRETEMRLHGPQGERPFAMLGLRRWKQANLTPLLGLRRGDVMPVDTVEQARTVAVRDDAIVLTWGVDRAGQLRDASDGDEVEVWQMEDGFVRSLGLGSDLIAPLSIVLDRKGLYFDPRCISDLEDILSHGVFEPGELAEAARVRAAIVDNGLTKYNVDQRARPDWATGGKKVILVPGQVENDASILFGTSEVATNLELLARARAAHPDGFIVYKPHPDVLAHNRKGRVHGAEARKLADHIETEISIVDCIEACDCLHTMTSLSGFDALLRGKRVVTYGQPFYAGWGLTTDMAQNGGALLRRTRRLALDELVAGTLLRYPIYWDPDLRGYTTCIATIERIVRDRARLEAQGALASLKPGYLRRQFRKLRILISAAQR
ncbi:capsular polysaccharide biosynthesis protein [Croceicoccus gelatinilyticus]|uniref:capsular polysaccharide biosynthesis protein n=1 Tax=Croceicoccus gelatinilyticus TaxID=2835536 RepID=UPI001BCB8825|nr:hypothetical protein [Croceicoccus gelatinilyticus]MBS7671194.1 capsular polysaccharide biosynthesis protein [Croceicoccus gelatinilyticus]